MIGWGDGYLYGARTRPTLPRWGVVVTEPPTVEPITSDQLTAIARIVPGDEEATLSDGYIRAARQQVEQDTGLALLTQTQDCYIDRFTLWPQWPGAVSWWAGFYMAPVALPSWPVQSIEVIEWIDVDGVGHVLDPSTYVLDTAHRPARVIWTSATVPTVPAGVRPFEAWHLQQVAGWATPDAVPPLLTKAVGELAAHFLTTGRDMVVIDARMEPLPMSYQQAIAPFRIELLA